MAAIFIRLDQEQVRDGQTHRQTDRQTDRRTVRVQYALGVRRRGLDNNGSDQSKRESWQELLTYDLHAMFWLHCWSQNMHVGRLLACACVACLGCVCVTSTFPTFLCAQIHVGLYEQCTRGVYGRNRAQAALEGCVHAGSVRSVTPWSHSLNAPRTSASCLHICLPSATHTASQRSLAASSSTYMYPSLLTVWPHMHRLLWLIDASRASSLLGSLHTLS